MVASSNQLPDETFCLLTGATGALGQEVLYSLFSEKPNLNLLVLARGGKGGSAEKRILSVLRKRFRDKSLDELRERVVVLDGDVTEPNFGLSRLLWDEIGSKLTSIIHCAAAVRFDQPLGEARQINLEGTRSILSLARLANRTGHFERFSHVSTAYIAGKRKGVVFENELEHRRGFHNTYEQSKYETEIMLRAAMGDLPITITRPSIIIGHSKTGETPNFKAFYWPLRVYAHNQLKVLPGTSGCRVDLVPVDYVSDAVTYLNFIPDSIGKTYHLTAGRENETTIKEVLTAAQQFFGKKLPYMLHPRYLKLIEGPMGKLVLSAHSRKTLQIGKPYYPYLSLNLEFDNSYTSSVLKKAGITTQPVNQFFDTLFRYCLETDWGKKPHGTVPVTRTIEETPQGGETRRGLDALAEA